MGLAHASFRCHAKLVSPESSESLAIQTIDSSAASAAVACQGQHLRKDKSRSH